MREKRKPLSKIAGERLKRLIKESKYQTQEEFAFAFGAETRTLIRWLNQGVYLIRNYGNRPVREYKKYQEQMQTDKEMYYNALVESNKILYRKKRLLRYIDKKKITIDQYEKVLMALCKAKTEADINAILTNALNCIIHHN